MNGFYPAELIGNVSLFYVTPYTIKTAFLLNSETPGMTPLWQFDCVLLIHLLTPNHQWWFSSGYGNLLVDKAQFYVKLEAPESRTEGSPQQGAIIHGRYWQDLPWLQTNQNDPGLDGTQHLGKWIFAAFKLVSSKGFCLRGFDFWMSVTYTKFTWHGGLRHKVLHSQGSEHSKCSGNTPTSLWSFPK